MPNEYFYFENHQKLSIYDDATSNVNDKGIFILQVSDNNYYTGDCVRVLTSDGFWDWSSPSHTDCWGNDLPAFQKKFVNRNGSGNRDKIRLSDSYSSFLYSSISKDGEIECNDWLHGYGFKNSFDTLFNDVFSPWSNPPAKTSKGQLVDFSMEVIRQTGSVVTVKFINQNASDGKPSKQQISLNSKNLDNPIQSDSINIVWGADFWDGLPIEPDYILSELQMKVDLGNWETIYLGDNRYWADSNYVYDQEGIHSISLRVRVCDNQNKWSIWSEVYETRKTMRDPDKNHLSEFRFYQNYPNPFNSTSVIKYSVPRSSQVKLGIFDVLGKKIATLVNEEKPSGSYEVVFYANNLASGMYVCKIQAGDFVQTRKMILLK